jgi:hypothetical protein
MFWLTGFAKTIPALLNWVDDKTDGWERLIHWAKDKNEFY